MVRGSGRWVHYWVVPAIVLLMVLPGVNGLPAPGLTGAVGAGEHQPLSSPAGSPYVNGTLVMSNGTLVGGNFPALEVHQPDGAVIDPARGVVYVVGLDDNLSAINVSTHKVVSSMSLGGNLANSSLGITLDSGKGELFVSNGNSVRVVSEATEKVVAVIPVAGSPGSLAYDPANGEVFVVDESSGNVSVISDSTDSIVNTVPVGTDPVALAYDTTKGEVFVANFLSNNVTVISASTDGTVANITVGTDPGGIAYDPDARAMYVANTNDNTVSVVNDSTFTVTTTIPLGTQTQPWGVAYDRGHKEIFLSYDGSDNVSVINCTSNTMVATTLLFDMPNETNQDGAVVYDGTTGELFVVLDFLDMVAYVSDADNSLLGYIPVGGAPAAIAFDSGKGELFVADEYDRAYVVSLATDHVITAITVGRVPDGAVYDSGHGEVYIANQASNNLSVISDTTYRVVANVSGVLFPRSAAYDNRSGKIFVTSYQGNTVAVVNDTTNRVVANVTVGNYSEDITYDSGKDEVFVTNELTNNVSVISGATDKVVRSISVGNAPDGVAYDRGNGEVFVANWGTHNVSVINDTTDLVVATINVGNAPGGMSYDAALGEVYVSNAASDNVSVISGSTNTVSASIDVLSGPGSSVYYPKGNEVYVADMYQDALSILYDGTYNASAHNRFAVDFKETGLPAGTAWSVKLGNFTGSSTNSTVAITMPNGTYPYAVVPVPGYDATPSSGSVTVRGTNQTMSISFTAIPFTVSFDEAGLPAGSRWTATFNGSSQSASTAQIVFGNVLTRPTPYAFSVAPSPGYAPSPSTGSVVVDGRNVTQSIAFTPYPDPGVGKVKETVCVWNGSVLPGNQRCPDGVEPTTDLFDPANKDLYVSDFWSGNVAVISLATNRVLTMIPVSGTPLGMAYDSGNGDIYVTDGYAYASNVTVINGSTNRVIASVHVGSPTSDATYDPTNGDIYVTDVASVQSVWMGVPGSWNVSVISGATNTVVKNITFAYLPGVLAFNRAADDVYVSGWWPYNTTVNYYYVGTINATSNTWATNHTVGFDVFAMTYDPANGNLYLASELPKAALGFVEAVPPTFNRTATNVTVGQTPSALAYDPHSGDLYASNYWSNNVSVISGASDRVVSNIAVGDQPEGVTFGPANGTGYVVNTGDLNVSVISDATNTVVASIRLGNNPAGITFDGANGDFYVVDTLTNWVDVISGSTGALLTSIPVGGPTIPWPGGNSGDAYDEQNHDIYVALQGSKDLLVIDGSTNQVTGTVSVGANQTGLIVYDPVNGDLYDVTRTGIVVIHGTNNTVVATLVGEGNGMAVDPANGDLYTSSLTASDSVTVINGTTNQIAASYNIGENDTWEGLFDPANGSVYLFTLSHGILVFSTSSHTVVGRFSEGDGAVGGVYDNRNSDIYIPNGISDNVSVVAALTNTVVATIPVQALPNQAAFDPSTGNVAVTDAFNAAVSIIGPPMYSVSMTETGLPPGTPWNITLGGVSNTSTTGSMSFPEINGTYQYVVAPVAGYAATPSSGTLAVNGTSTPLNITFVRVPSGTVLSAVTVTPPASTVPAGQSASFTAVPACSGGPCPSNGVAYAWSLSNSSLGTLGAGGGKNVTFTAGGTAGTLTITVNATLNGTSKVGSATITVVSSPPPTLSYVSISPSAKSLTAGATQVFSATVTCNGGTCPSGTTYSWSLNNSLGTLSPGSGSTVTFTAGTRAGDVSLTVLASLSGKNATFTSAITITSSALVLPTSVAISPSSASLRTGSSAAFSASVSCGANPCPAGTSYAWSLSDTTKGSLNVSAGRLVTFTAGSTVGKVNLMVTATLNGKSVNSAIPITLTARGSAGSQWFDILVLILVVVAAVVGVVTYLMIRRRTKSAPHQPPPPPPPAAP